MSENYKFYGTRKGYKDFIRELHRILLLQGIEYLNNVAEIDGRLTAPVLPAAVVDGGNAETRATINRRNEAEYNNRRRKYDSDILLIENDFGKAIGIICGIVDSAVRAEIDPIIVPMVRTSNRNKFTNVLAHILNKYGPTNANDTFDITNRIKEARASTAKEFAQLIRTYDEGQAELAMIPMRNPVGAILLDLLGQPITYAYPQEMMKSCLVDQLGRSELEDLRAIRRQSIEQPALTYADIRNKLEQHLKVLRDDEDTKPAMINSYQPASLHAGAASSFNVAENHPKQLRNVNRSASTVTCSNCSQRGHYVRDCNESFCYTCGIEFYSPEIRLKHANDTHTAKRARSPAYKQRSYHNSSSNDSPSAQEYNSKRVKFHQSSGSSAQQRTSVPRNRNNRSESTYIRAASAIGNMDIDQHDKDALLTILNPNSEPSDSEQSTA